MSLKPESRWSATLIQTVSVLSAVAVAVWVLRGELEAMRSESSKINDRLVSIETFMKSEAVTQSQAERYAAAFRWENRSLDLTVPEPKRYQ